MEERNYILYQFCKAKFLVRSNYYSDTYRARFKIGDALHDWDVTHIQLPFPKEKEQQLMARFGIPKSELKDTYEGLAQCVNTEYKIIRYLEREGAKPNVFVQYYDPEVKIGEDGQRDVYLVSEPMSPAVDMLIRDGSIALLDLVMLGARLLQMLREAIQFRVNMGVPDLDCMYIHPSGKMVYGSFLYGGMEGTVPPKPLKTMPQNMAPGIRNGEDQPSIANDMYAIAGLLWTLGNGQHYWDKPNFEEAPQYLPQDVISILVMLMEGRQPDVVNAKNAFFEVRQKIQSGAIENIQIPIADPPALKAAEEPAEQEIETVNNEEVDSASLSVAGEVENLETSDVEDIQMEEIEDLSFGVIEDIAVRAPDTELVEYEIEILDGEEDLKNKSTQHEIKERENTLSVELVEPAQDFPPVLSTSEPCQVTKTGKAKMPKKKKRLTPFIILLIGILLGIALMWSMQRRGSGEPEETSSPEPTTAVAETERPMPTENIVPETPEISIDREDPEETPAPEKTPEPKPVQTPEKPLTTPVPTPKPTPVPKPTATPKPTPEPTPEVISKPTAEPTEQPTGQTSEDTLTVAPMAATIKVGEIVQLKPTVSCYWSCSDLAIATVVGGYVTGKAPGTCIITAKTADKTQSVEITITVQ